MVTYIKTKNRLINDAVKLAVAHKTLSPFTDFRRKFFHTWGRRTKNQSVVLHIPLIFAKMHVQMGQSSRQFCSSLLCGFEPWETFHNSYQGKWIKWKYNFKNNSYFIYLVNIKTKLFFFIFRKEWRKGDPSRWGVVSLLVCYRKTNREPWWVTCLENATLPPH
jgi:hypothetical protein